VRDFIGGMAKSILGTLAGNFTESFSDFDLEKPQRMQLTDPMLQSAWVNICVYLRARNIQRAPYRIMKGTRIIDSGPFYTLFNKPNPAMSAARLWFLTEMWFDINGEFFWWFGPDYLAGIPKELYVVNPNYVTHERTTDTWIYREVKNGQTTEFPLMPGTFIHIWEPNPWRSDGGVSPMVALALELEQDLAINKEHLAQVRNSAIPEGLIRTDQTLTPDKAREIRDLWEEEHGKNRKNAKIAVLGSGSHFVPLNQDLIKYSALKDVNKLTIATKYGIPAKVLNISNEKTALSGKDSNEQYKALWSQTLIPQLHFLEDEVAVNFFMMFGQEKIRGEFDISVIPELQEDDADLHKRLREDIQVDLITINEAREVLRRDPVEWGDTPWTELSSKQQPKDDAGDEPDKPAEDPDDEDGGKFFPFLRRKA
jgi:HK97 family phage portal protein